MENNFAVSSVQGEKRGIPVYTSNPSIPNVAEFRKPRRVRIGDEKRGFEVGSSLDGEAAIAYQWEEVDKERFVKLYLDGLKQASGLSKAGLSVFEVVYRTLRESHGKDTIVLSCMTSSLKRSVYYRGLRELLEKEFLYRSPLNETFFVNIRFMFNGDRLAFVKGYKLRGATPEQASLPLLDGGTANF